MFSRKYAKNIFIIYKMYYLALITKIKFLQNINFFCFLVFVCYFIFKTFRNI